MTLKQKELMLKVTRLNRDLLKTDKDFKFE